MLHLIYVSIHKTKTGIITHTHLTHEYVKWTKGWFRSKKHKFEDRFPLFMCHSVENQLTYFNFSLYIFNY